MRWVSQESHTARNVFFGSAPAEFGANYLGYAALPGPLEKFDRVSAESLHAEGACSERGSTTVPKAIQTCERTSAQISWDGSIPSGIQVQMADVTACPSTCVGYRRTYDEFLIQWRRPKSFVTVPTSLSRHSNKECCLNSERRKHCERK